MEFVVAPVRAVILRNSACIRGSTNAVIFRLTGFAVGIGYKDTRFCANAQVAVYCSVWLDSKKVAGITDQAYRNIGSMSLH